MVFACVAEEKIKSIIKRGLMFSSDNIIVDYRMITL
jgi:hypothetical protein